MKTPRKPRKKTSAPAVAKVAKDTPSPSNEVASGCTVGVPVRLSAPLISGAVAISGSVMVGGAR